MNAASASRGTPSPATSSPPPGPLSAPPGTPPPGQSSRSQPPLQNHYGRRNTRRKRPKRPAKPPNKRLVVLDRVSRNYGQTLGLSHLNLTFAPGITALLGPNGAGKSTLMKLVLGLARPSLGFVWVFGRDPFHYRALGARLGFVPEFDCFYENHTGLHFVTHFLRLQGYEREEAERRARLILEKLGLAEALDRPIATYSRGMRQKVKVARAVAHDPDLLVLDEPFQGTDPSTRHLLMENIRQWAAAGKTILISSHILHEVESLTDRIVLLNRGQVLATGNRQEIRALMAHVPKRIWLVPPEEDRRRLGHLLLEEQTVRAVSLSREPNGVWVETYDAENFYRALPRMLHAEKLRLTHLSSPDDSLDTLYNYLVGGRQWG